MTRATPMLLLACLLSVSLPAFATVYTVAGEQAGAADTNPGTDARPFKTISAAIARVQPGDTVLVKNGTYRESVVSPLKEWNDPAKRCTLAAAPGHRPVIKGSDVLPTTWQRLPGDKPIFVQPRDVYTQMLFVDEQPLMQIGLQGSPRRAASTNGFQFTKQWRGKGLADMAAGSFFYDDQAKQLYAWLTDGTDPGKHLMEAAVRADGVMLTGTWTLRGLQIRHMNDGFWPHEQAVGVTGNRAIVEDCRITHNDLLGLIVSGEDCVIRRNEIAYSGLMGFTSNVGYRMLFEGNELHHNATRGDVVCLTAGNKMVVWRDCKFLRNWWHDEPATALWLDISDGNILIAENRFDNCYCGIYFEICRWGVIANNVLRHCGRAIWSYSADVLIAHNVLDQCPEGIIISGFQRTCDVVQKMGEPSEGALMAVRNNLVVNNLLLDSVGAFIGITEDDGYGAGNWSDHNVFAWTLPTSHPTGMHLNFMKGWDTLYGKLPIWRVERHQDEHSVVADPALLRQLENGNPWIGLSRSQLMADVKLVDRAKGNYHLQPDSPARGAGVRLPDVLNSPYRPGAGREIVSREWARTSSVAAPPELKGRAITDYAGGHYRLQPLPGFHRLADLDAAAPDDPGLNERWLKAGQYPTFDATSEPETATADAWSVHPVNRLKDPSFLLPLGKPGEDATGRWLTQGRVFLYMNMACLNLTPGDQRPSFALQKVGQLAPDTEYILWSDMIAYSADPRFTARGQVLLAAGDALTPVGQPAQATGRPGETGHWYTGAVRVKTGAAGTDPRFGQDLYVVIGGDVAGPADAPPDTPVGGLRWDNLVLLTSAKP